MSNKLATLKFLDYFYEKNGGGCTSLQISTDKNIIEELILEGLIFKTNQGYFISTFGKEYLLNNQ